MSFAHRCLLAVVLVSVVGLAGCFGGPDSTRTPPPTATDTATATGTLSTSPQSAATTAAVVVETPTPPTNRPTVTLQDRNGTTLATVAVTIADTPDERYTGLSETASLDDDEGMLFVYDREGRHTYVMRNMSFPLDIVYVAANGTVTTIHHAETEPGERGGELTDYPGRGQYVLEVPRGYTNQTSVEVGDTVVVPADL